MFMAYHDQNCGYFMKNLSSSVKLPKNRIYEDKLDPWSSHSVIAELLSKFPAGTRILDIGTASGTIGRICQGKGFIMHGIEPMAEWANESQTYYDEIVVCDLAHTKDEYLASHHVVICADVLEHMADSEIQLTRLVRLQFPGTLFILSLPNIANIWVRINLLLGKFDYSDRGILDRTHLRFFTRLTAIKMVNSSGLQIERVIPTPIPLNLISPFFSTTIGKLLHSALARLTRAFPTLLGYQFIMTAKYP